MSSISFPTAFRLTSYPATHPLRVRMTDVSSEARAVHLRDTRVVHLLPRLSTSAHSVHWVSEAQS